MTTGSKANVADGKATPKSPEDEKKNGSTEAALPAAEASANLPATQNKAGALAVAAKFSDLAGAGMENVTSKDLLIPRISILQGLSPQVLKSKPEFIPEAKVGDICDIGLREILPSPLIYLPVHFSKVWIEWAPRATGKGLVAIHEDVSCLDDCKPDEKKRMIVTIEGPRKGNLISETAQFFGLNLSRNARRAFIPMAGTMLRASRFWNTLASSELIEREDHTTYTPPLFYRSYHLSTVETTNNEGTWSTWKIDRHTALPDMEGWESLLERAKAFRESILKGETKADNSDLEPEATAGNAGAQAAGAEGRM